MTRITATKLARMRRIKRHKKDSKGKLVGYEPAQPRKLEYFPKDNRLSWLVSIGQIINWSKWLKRKNNKIKKWTDR